MTTLLLLLLQGSATIDEVPEQFVERIEWAIAHKDWPTVVLLVTMGGRHYASCHVEREGFSEFVERRCAGLGDDFLAEYRRVHEDDPGQFFTRAAATALDKAGDEYAAGGERGRAIRAWRRIFFLHSRNDVPIGALALKLARAAAESGEAALVDAVRKKCADDGIDVDLSKIAVKVAPEKIAPAKQPTVPEAEFPKRGVLGVRNEFELWSAPLESRAVKGPPQFPYLAGSAVIKGRAIVIVGDGESVTAIEPAAMRLDDANAGVLWRWSGTKRPSAGSSLSVQPRLGATISDGLAFVTLYGEKQPAPPPESDFAGAQEIACFDALTGKLRWRADAGLTGWSWAFSGPPVAWGDSVYAGVCRAPGEAAESRVVCFDRASGRRRWQRTAPFVPVARSPRWGPPNATVTYLTTMTPYDGAIIVQTNAGSVLSLDALTGNPKWVMTYPRNLVEKFVTRDGAPIVRGGTVYVLAQDAADLLQLDAETGGALVWQVPGQRDVSWMNCTQAVGTMGGWLVIGGSESYVINLVDRFNDKGELRTLAGRTYSLPRSNVSRCGRAFIDGETAYFPTCEDTVGTLSIYHGFGAFKNVDAVKWRKPGEYGNLLVAGKRLVVTTSDRVVVYADIASLRADFAPRLDQSPPDPAALEEFARLVIAKGPLLEAVPLWRRLQACAKGEGALEARAFALRKDLYSKLWKGACLPEAMELAHDEATFNESHHAFLEQYGDREDWKAQVQEARRRLEAGWKKD